MNITVSGLTVIGEDSLNVGKNSKNQTINSVLPVFILYWFTGTRRYWKQGKKGKMSKFFLLMLIS